MKQRGDMRLTTALAYLEAVLTEYHAAMRQLYEDVQYDPAPSVEDAAIFLQGVPERPPMNPNYARLRREKLMIIDHVLQRLQ